MLTAKPFKRILIASLLMFALVCVPVVAHAQAGDDRAPDEPVSSDESRRYDYGNGQGSSGSADQRGCEARAASINAIMDRSLRRAENHAELFATMSERVQAFYEQQGNDLANYRELVATVDAAAAQTEVDLRTMTDASEFSCGSDQPKEDVQVFRQALRTTVQDLKDYRAALKDLIAGVRTAQDGGE